MGAVQFMVAWELPAVAEVMVGASGIVIFGVTELDELDGYESPASVVATTVKV